MNFQLTPEQQKEQKALLRKQQKQQYDQDRNLNRKLASGKPLTKKDLRKGSLAELVESVNAKKIIKLERDINKLLKEKPEPHMQLEIKPKHPFKCVDDEPEPESESEYESESEEEEPNANDAQVIEQVHIKLDDYAEKYGSIKLKKLVSRYKLVNKFNNNKGDDWIKLIKHVESQL